MFQTSYLGFLFAGRAFIWAWPVVLFGQMMVALQFAELSAHYPLAGSIYQWSKQVAGKAWAWNTGWIYLCAQIVTVPAVALGWQVILPQITTEFQFIKCALDRAGRAPDYIERRTSPRTPSSSACIMIGLTTLINCAGVSCSRRINNIGVAAELIGAAGLILIFLYPCQPGPRRPSSTDTAGTGAGHDWGYFGALLIGAIMPLYVMYGFDTAGSLAEETDDPQRKRAPRRCIQALSTAGMMGFLLIAVRHDGGQRRRLREHHRLAGWPASRPTCSASTWGKVFLADVALAIFVCCLAIHAMCVRILFAMGRDNKLPFATRLASRLRPAPGAGGAGRARRHHRVADPGVQLAQPVRVHDRDQLRHRPHVPRLPWRHHPAVPAAP